MQDFAADLAGSRPIPRPQEPRARHFRTLRVVTALILRETGSRDTRNSLGFLWNLIDPVISIAMLSLLFGMISRTPRLGSNFPLFYVSGVVPFHLYQSISGRVSTSLRFSRNLLGFPSVTVIDIILARFILNAMTNVCVFIIMIVLIDEYYGLQLKPYMGAMLQSLSMAMALGLGIGTLNAILFLASSTYESLWSIVMRPLLLLSGVMFLIEDMPEPIFNVLKWNPVAQVIAEMRHAFYATYDISWVMPGFVYLISGLCFTLGLIGLHRYVFDALDN